MQILVEYPPTNVVGWIENIEKLLGTHCIDVVTALIKLADGTSIFCDIGAIFEHHVLAVKIVGKSEWQRLDSDKIESIPLIDQLPLLLRCYYHEMRGDFTAEAA